DLHPILEKIAQYKGDDIELLIELMHYIRPNNKKEETTIDEKITYFIVQLKDNHHLLLGLQTYILRVLRDKRFSTILTESNMMLDTEFWGELVNRSILKILPKQPLKTSLEYVIANVFNYESDIKWIKNINLSLKEQLIHLLFPVDLNALKNTNPVIQELIYSCDILMHRLSGHAFDTNILKLVPEYAKLNNPFTGLQIDLGTYLRDLSNDVISRSTDELKYKQVVILLALKPTNNFF
nr:hypothetical protein [Saprospiraceae bacterium]